MYYFFAHKKQKVAVDEFFFCFYFVSSNSCLSGFQKVFRPEL
jgi:hypothetical protein